MKNKFENIIKIKNNNINILEKNHIQLSIEINNLKNQIQNTKEEINKIPQPKKGSFEFYKTFSSLKKTARLNINNKKIQIKELENKISLVKEELKKRYIEIEKYKFLKKKEIQKEKEIIKKKEIKFLDEIANISFNKKIMK